MIVNVDVMQACGEAYSELSCESLQLPTGSFQNQPLPENQGKIVRPRKRGIQALLADSTNIEAADFQQPKKEQAEVKLQAYACASEKLKPLGDALKGSMEKLKNASSRKSSNTENSKTTVTQSILQIRYVE